MWGEAKALERLPSLVEDVMSSPVITIDGEASIREGAQLMRDRKIGCLIVTIHERPEGILTERDILERVVAQNRDINNTRVREVMSAPLITVHRRMGILEAMRIMRRRNIRRLVVMENHTLLGIVTERDIIRGVTIASLTSFTTLLRREELEG
ncbi:MAG: CBS domain-containing protein [Candidatus Bathyarchaeia archaeon]|nr:CBS domain-containing protein [Candidatus Bathyarchaeota archaeon]